MTDLPDTMRTVVIDEPGAEPRIEERPLPRPAPGEVLVRIAASPINPSDLMALQGLYGTSWAFPLIPGFEGSGRVVAAGGGLLGRYLMGRSVACVADKQGLWAEYAVTRAARCVALPGDLPLGPAAMSFVNPLTALALVRIAGRGGHGSAISTAAGGALGRMIQARARMQGLKIINVVRRPEQAEEMRAAGVSRVLSTEAPDFDERLAEICRRLRCRIAFDAVGGALTGRLVQAMGRRSEVLVYGALAMEPVTLNPGTMIFKGRHPPGLLAVRLAYGAQFPRTTPHGAVGHQGAAWGLCRKQGRGRLRPGGGRRGAGSLYLGDERGEGPDLDRGRTARRRGRGRGCRRMTGLRTEINGVEIHLPSSEAAPLVARALRDGTYEGDEANAAERCVREGFRVLELGGGHRLCHRDLCTPHSARKRPDGRGQSGADPGDRGQPRPQRRGGCHRPARRRGAARRRGRDGRLSRAGPFPPASRLGARGGQIVEVPLIGFHDLLRAHRPHCGA